MKCPHCKSTSIEYYPDVDSQSWVRHIYTQTSKGWEIKVFADENVQLSFMEETENNYERRKYVPSNKAQPT